ncbi:hypothetical protein Pflav_054510 [Phytohabitans flavus]|uniref:Beta-glucosidase n=1 Tax=Phytohabitans flavus TaxID=1076124 RepID=A0A6F8XZ81_9ACTN|nr:hypothetical protein Pflav_054510 [Phytohabitans flavus]
MAFTWGVSTAAYQIEGGVGEGGRGLSIWDTFSHEPGRISDGSTGDVACDHFHRYAEDVDLMAGLGIDAYRFSVAWPRIQPDGTGPANATGLDFYDRLVDALLGKGIDPVVTLFHWDLPQALQDKGGWLSRDTAFRFAEYAGLVAAALGDRVRLWITLNEPFVHMTLGYATGEHAPGQTLLFDALPVAHHQLLGHGLAVTALRAQGAAAVAIANNYTPIWPIGEGDVAAAAAYHALHNRLFTDPCSGAAIRSLGWTRRWYTPATSTRSRHRSTRWASTTTTPQVYVHRPLRTARCRSNSCRSRATPRRRSAGRWSRTGCGSCSCRSKRSTASRSRPSTSPRAAARTTGSTTRNG